MKGRLALAGAALLLCGCAAQIESPRVVDKRRRQMGRGLSHDQKLGMKALSDQGLTAQQIQEQMQIEKTQDEIVEIVKSVKAADMTLFGREGRLHALPFGFWRACWASWLWEARPER